MTTLAGRDSAFGPTAEAAGAAVAAGVEWWEVYVGGPGAFHTWSPAEVDVIRRAGLRPLAIWVPTYGLEEDPVAAAHDAIEAMEGLGIYGAMCLDTEEEMIAAPGLRRWVDAFTGSVPMPSVYAGAGYCPPSAHPIWTWWGSSVVPGAGQGAQYGPAEEWGMAVDVDLVDAAFPLSAWTDPIVPAPPAPTPKEAPVPPVPFLAICDDEDSTKVRHQSVWVIWPSGLRTWVDSETTEAAYMARFGQADLVPLSSKALEQLPTAPT